jgi:NAD(P)H-nitrite reductase large subunit
MSTLICYCYRVEKKTLVAAIESGCKTWESLSQATGACQGCGGCRWDLESLIEFYGTKAEAKTQRNTETPS